MFLLGLVNYYALWVLNCSCGCALILDIAENCDLMSGWYC